MFHECRVSVATPAALSTALARARAIGPAHGIYLKLPKCAVYLPESVAIPAGVALPVKRVSRPRVLRQNAFPSAATPAANAQELNMEAPTATVYRDMVAARRDALQTLTQMMHAGLRTQSAWGLFKLFVAGDANWIARTAGIPQTVAQELDELCRNFVETTFGISPDNVQLDRVFLRARDGGLGVQSVERMRWPAFCSSWATALPHVAAMLGCPDARAVGDRLPNLAPVLATLATHMSDELDTAVPMPPDLPQSIVVRQSTLAEAAHAKALQEWLQHPAVTDETRAWLHSCGGPGASAWMQPVVTPAAQMTNEHFWIAMRLRLMQEVVPEGACSLSGPHAPACGTTADCRGRHSLMCQHGGGLVQRHNAIRDVLSGILQDMGAHNVQKEVLLPAAAGQDAGRMDVAFFTERGNVMHVDISVVHPASSQALRGGSAQRPGAAAGIAETAKRRRYPQSPLAPAIFETGGRPGEEFLRLLRAAAPMDSERTHTLHCAWQALGATLQRENARTLLRARSAAVGD